MATFAPEAKIIHVDIDPAEQGKVRRPDVPIVGDCRLVIEELVREHRASCWPTATVQADTRRWKSRISGWRETFPLTYEPSRAGRGAEAAVLPRGAARLGSRRRILVSGVGQHQMWSSQYWKFSSPTRG